MYGSAGVRVRRVEERRGEFVRFVHLSHQKVICFRNSNHVVMYIISPDAASFFIKPGLDRRRLNSIERKVGGRRKGGKAWPVAREKNWQRIRKRKFNEMMIV